MSDARYETFKNMPTDQLMENAVGSGTGSSLDMAKLVLEERLLEKQHEYAKEQIDLQHERQLEIVKKQGRRHTTLVIISVMATLAATVLGWYLGRSGSY